MGNLSGSSSLTKLPKVHHLIFSHTCTVVRLIHFVLCMGCAVSGAEDQEVVAESGKSGFVSN